MALACIALLTVWAGYGSAAATAESQPGWKVLGIFVVVLLSIGAMSGLHS